MEKMDEKPYRQVVYSTKQIKTKKVGGVLRFYCVQKEKTEMKIKSLAKS